MDKISARKMGLQARNSLSPSQRSQYDEERFRQLIPLMKNVKCLGTYVSIGSEADTRKILQYCWQNGIQTAVPKTEGDSLTFYAVRSYEDLAVSFHRLLEPVTAEIIPLKQIDLMLVPLSCYDSKNSRTGYGKGYYDHVLKECRLTAGLAYPQQETDRIETDPWDVPLDIILNGKEVLKKTEL